MGTRQYSHAHNKMRRELDPLVQAGGIDCWRCGEEIQPGTPWDLGHDDLDPDQYRGPEHRRCNRATKGRAPNQPAAIPFAPSGRCAPRDCEVCALEYRPTYSGQRTCGRACGVELQRRNRPPAKPKVRKPTPRRRPQVCTVRFGTCERCGEPFAAKTKAKRFCSDACRYRHSKPEVHQCADCGADIERSRMKCDECVVRSKRARKARERQTEADKRRRREYKARRRVARRALLGGAMADAPAA